MSELTDAFIAELKALPKRISNPGARNSAKERHIERNYQVSADGHEFHIFMRQSALVLTGFSCGLVWHAPDGSRPILARYNGSDHPHLNPIEGDRVDFLFHIHTRTERYAAIGRKPEHFAEPTDRFRDSTGALRCLLLDWNIAGLDLSPQESLI
jgi:hypothetical protein